MTAAAKFTAASLTAHSFARAAIAIVAVGILGLVGCDRGEVTVITPTAAPQTGTVTFQFEMSGTAQSESASTVVVEVTDVATGETIESVMRRIDSPEIEISGGGTTAFVNRIGDLTTASGEGWTYTIDGDHADYGIGSMELEPPATVRWTYGGYDQSSPLKD